MIEAETLIIGLCRTGIDLRQIGVLLACTAHGPAAPKSRELGHIAKHLGVSKTAVWRHCNRLEKLGLTTRAVIEEDHRRCLVSATGAGANAADQIRRGVTDLRLVAA